MKNLLFISFFSFAFLCLSAQSINTEFGKNRVQFHNDFTNWWRYETENFITYWYGKARNVAIPSIQLAEMDFEEIQKRLEHRINDKIEIVVYTDLSDLKQSNIGLSETFMNEAGRTKVVGNKVFVYFNGNHQHLRKQLRGGTATIFMNSLLFGNTLQEMVQNAVSVNVPDWYYQGMIAYIKDGWDIEADNQLRQRLTRKKRPYKNFDKLARDEPQLAGQALWYYLDQLYGSSTLSNLIYLSRINRSIESGFIYVLGFNFTEITDDWFHFFSKIYNDELPAFDKGIDTEGILIMDKCVVHNFEVNPQETKLLYARNNRDRVQVRMLDLKTGSDKKIFTYGKVNGLQETDYNYPLLSWSPSGDEVSVVYEKRDIIYHRKIQLRDLSHETVPFAPEYQRVYSMKYIDSMDFIISANTDGFSDLYRYKSKTRESTRLTQDFYDDLDVEIVSENGENHVLFASNRTAAINEKLTLDTILPIEYFKLYLLDLEDPAKIKLIGDKNLENMRFPISLGGGSFACLSEISGIRNLQAVEDRNDREYAHLTNFDRNILEHTFGKEHYFYSVNDGKFHYLVRKKIDFANSFDPVFTKARLRNSDLTDKELDLFEKRKEFKPWLNRTGKDNAEAKSFPDAIKFQTEFDDPVSPLPDLISEIMEDLPSVPFKPKKDDVHTGVLKFNQVRATASRLNFRIDDYSTKLDNSVLFEGLDSYAGEREEYNYTPMGILMKANVKDLFEDYTIEGGIRVPTSFSGSEIFIVLDDKKKRLDKRYALYRKTQTNRGDIFSFTVAKTRKNSLIGLYQLRYPLDIFTSLRLSTTLRNDRYYSVASDDQAFQEPIDYTQRLGLKLEYVFDNSIQRDLNLLTGMRYKFYAEAVNRFDIQLAEPRSFKPSTAFMTILGVDFRRYIPLDGRSIFAIRLAAASTFGSEKNLFFLGGVENWFLPQFEQNIPLPTDDNFAYKTIAPNVRGFSYNIRNGSSFALGNMELRMPIFQYATQRRIRYSFFRHFQLVGFLDAGTAWHGLSPYSDKNPLNTVILEKPPTVTMKVNYFRDPLVIGYGLGVRSMVLGYFVRLDYARGIETRQIQEPRVYISFGTDF